jgi:hypothetical protein
MTAKVLSRRRRAVRSQPRRKNNHSAAAGERTNLPRADRVPRRVAAVIAVMEMGITDYSKIARAVGISVQEVQRIDRADDPLVRKLAGRRRQTRQYFTLARAIRCPKCSAKVTIAPCVACDSRTAQAQA